MRLGEKQELFMRLLPRLIDQAHDLGFAIRGGDLFRDPRIHAPIGKPNIIKFLLSFVMKSIADSIKEAGFISYGRDSSAHKLKLAIDLNLFKDGAYMADTEDHRELGEWWERQHELCRWGGRFDDGNHYSLEHNGCK